MKFPFARGMRGREGQNEECRQESLLKEEGENGSEINGCMHG